MDQLSSGSFVLVWAFAPCAMASQSKSPRHLARGFFLLIQFAIPYRLKLWICPYRGCTSALPREPREGADLTSLSGFPRPSPAILRISPLLLPPRHRVDSSRVRRDRGQRAARSVRGPMMACMLYILAQHGDPVRYLVLYSGTPHGDSHFRAPADTLRCHC